MNLFSNVAGLKPGKSFFNLSYGKKFNCDMAKLIPVMCDEAVPGDIFMIGNEIVCRFEPMVAPIMQEVNIKVRYFFVPYRLLKRDCLATPGDTFDWELFISGGVDGKDTTQVLPRWKPTSGTGNAKYSLWDYLGFPVGIDPKGAYPLNFPREAYNFIFNEYFRNENLDSEVSLDNESILNVRWNKDYFTAALPWQQRGTAPVLSGDIMYEDTSGDLQKVYMQSLRGSFKWLAANNADSDTSEAMSGPGASGDQNDMISSGVFGTKILNGPSDLVEKNPKGGYSELIFGGFNIAQLRLCVQTQKWLERNARAGARYTELLRAHFGVAPLDERLDRPEYIGGTSSPVVVSEVLQTSSTDATSPQGTMAGHGISIDKNYAAKYRVQEYGLIMGLAYIVPKHQYSSQGINRQWLRRNKLDFYFPEFAHLSEQGIETAELYATNTEADNLDVFGYIGRFDEMRHKQSMVCADMRDDFQFWHLNDVFASKPLLNSSFVECTPSKRVFAVQTKPCIKVDFGNIIHAYRPLPLIGEPGLVDHY